MAFTGGAAGFGPAVKPDDWTNQRGITKSKAHAEMIAGTRRGRLHQGFFVIGCFLTLFGAFVTGFAAFVCGTAASIAFAGG